jgi:hypothetical protein
MATCINSLATCRKEEFWLTSPTELYKDNNFLKFYPKYEMTRTEQLNAITRFMIYVFIILIIFNKDRRWLYLPVSIILLTVVFYYITKTDQQAGFKELDRLLTIRKEKRDAAILKEQNELKHDGAETYNIDVIDETAADVLRADYKLETGTYDSDGILRIGGEEALRLPKNIDEQQSLYNVDEINQYQENTCRRPTKNNPFMNPNITDYNNGYVPAACNVDDDQIKDDMYVNFNEDLFRDVDEVWERENSQRQFYTIPNTAVPNNQVEFAKWLYKAPSCKVDQEHCLRYEDLRYKR